jgi:osmotically-inducible protein OsmY
MDHETVEALKRRLQGSSYLALRNIECVFHDGVVTVQGCVPTYYLKQLAQEIVTEIAGVRVSRNQIEVTSRAYPGTSGRNGRSQAAQEGYRSEVSDPWN